MAKERVLREAVFQKRVVDYWLLSGSIAFACTIVGLPLAAVWYFAGRPLCMKFLERMSCTLTTRNLIIKKGLLNRIEKTVPLEKITDLSMYQGPIMRAMGLKGFRVETAGTGSAGAGYLIGMIGIEDTEGFRDLVLDQRDRVSEREDHPPAAPAMGPQQAGAGDAVLIEIRDTLARIEDHLRSTHLKSSSGGAP